MWTTSSASVLLVEGLGLAVEASRARVGPDTGLILRTARTGGEGSFNYTFAVLDLSGAATDTWTSPPAIPGSYLIAVTITDNNGTSANDSIWVLVEAAGGSSESLALDISSSNQTLTIEPGGSTNLVFNITGGIPVYSCVYSASGLGGSGVFTTGSPQDGLLGDAGDTWTAPGGAVSATITVTVTDDSGATFTDSVTIEVQ